MTLREQILAYLRDLPPHVRERKTSQLLAEAAKEIGRLEQNVVSARNLTIAQKAQIIEHLNARMDKVATQVNERSKPNPTA